MQVPDGADGVHVEVEVKLHVGDTVVDDVLRAMADLGALRTVPMEAAYLDTLDWRLTGAGLTWRLRREGTRWVQTLKAPGDDDTRRLEHEVDVTPVRSDAAGEAPAVDASRHAASPIGRRLVALLDDLALHGVTPVVRFRTDVVRREVELRAGRGTVLLSLDRGVITAPTAAGHTASVPVSELEIELVDGDAVTVTEVAAEWSARFGLPLDRVNKARRGRLLADRLTPPVGDATPRG